MEFKGTKGEWGYCPTEIQPKKYMFSVLVEGTGTIIADVYRKRDWDDETGSTERPDVTEANAQLIAAAPDLLEALQQLCDRLESKELEGYVFDKWKNGKNAINKAFGHE